MESEGETKYGDTEIPRQVWDEEAFMHLTHVQYLMKDTKWNALENNHNADLCYWKYWTINIFIVHMR